jgi:hypothetical protein
MTVLEKADLNTVLRRQSRTGRRGQPEFRNSRTPGQDGGRATPLHFSWGSSIPKKKWLIYSSAISAAREAGVPFLLGGGLAMMAFTGQWRDTKDIDIYILPKHRRAMIGALTRAGFADYYPRQRYDRRWIYRGFRDGVNVDIMWGMANHIAQVSEEWFERAGWIQIRGEKLWVAPMEEMMWCKLYILQRNRCDWIHLFNLVFARSRDIDWGHLLSLLKGDAPLLKAFLTVYTWLCPNQALGLPKNLRKQLGGQGAGRGKSRTCEGRARLLDTRAWFAGSRNGTKRLEV